MAAGRDRAVRLPAVAAVALAGNLLVQQLPALPPSAWCWLALLLAAVGLLPRRTRLAGCFALAVGWTLVSARAAVDARWPPPREPHDVEIAGFVETFPIVEAGRAVFTFRVTQASVPKAPERVRLSWYDPPADLAAGASLELVARLRAPRGLANPRGFDYERWLLVEGIGATGYVRAGRVEPGIRHGTAQAWQRLRARLAERIERSIADPSAAALVVALSLGERGGFDDENWSALRRTGTSHLVAISGMHVGLVAALAFWLALRLGLLLPYTLARHALSIAAVAAILPACAYAALAGFALPTQRALVMVLVAEAVVLTRRRPALASSFAIALLIVLGLDPLATLEASFWLSFGAVGAILVMAGMPRPAMRAKEPIDEPAARGPPRSGRRGRSECRAGWPDRRDSRLWRAVGGFSRLQWGITLGLVPLLAAFFGEVSLLALPVNLVAIPFVSLVMVPASLATLVCTALGSDGFGLVDLCAKLAAVTWMVLKELAGVHLAALALPPPGALALAGSVCAVLLALPRHPLPGRRLAWLGLLPLFLRPDTRLPAGAVEVLVLDVGHGLSVLVETREHRLLYDAGPVYRSGFDAGAEIVAPVLADRPVLDLLVLSHGDADHAGGAGAVLARFPTAGRLFGPDVTDLAGERCTRGREWRWDGVAFSVLHPPAGFARLGNESSCVLRIDSEHGSVLLTGDIEARAEQLLAAEPLLRADVVIVPHHGSATSSSPAFARAVAPTFAVVSAGFDNRWGFPRAEVSRRWVEAGATVLVTGDVGAVRIRIDDEWDVRLERTAVKRYWRD